MHPYVKAFMALWFGFVGWLIWLDFLHPKATSAHSGGVGMIVVGIAILMAGRWFARDDEAWLSEVTCGALQPQVLVQPEDTQT